MYKFSPLRSQHIKLGEISIRWKIFWITSIVFLIATTIHANKWHILQLNSKPDTTVITRESDNTKGVYIVYAMRDSKETGFISFIQFYLKTESNSICQKYVNELGMRPKYLVNHEKMIEVETSCNATNELNISPITADALAYLKRTFLNLRELYLGSAKFDMSGSRTIINEQKKLLKKRSRNLQ